MEDKLAAMNHLDENNTPACTQFFTVQQCKGVGAF
jgi:hypothetical protein